MNLKDIVYGTPVVPIYGFPPVNSEPNPLTNSRSSEVPFGIPFMNNGLEIPFARKDKCSKCQGSIENQKTILENVAGFVCATCHCVLTGKYARKDGLVYCEEDYEKLVQELIPENDTITDVELAFTTQPAPYQIANYNIFPSAVVTIDRVLPNNQTVFLTLVDSNTREVVKGGFVSGDVRVIRAGSQKVRLSGLKLNKMGPIKHELQSKKTRSVNSEFRLRVKLESKICYSDPFKLYSSCSQLPSDIRMDVRPTKRVTPRKRKNEDSETDSDKGQSSPIQNSNFENNNNNSIVLPPPLNVPVNTNTNLTTEEFERTMKITRDELEAAIRNADIENSGKIAQKLAMLQGIANHLYSNYSQKDKQQ